MAVPVVVVVVMKLWYLAVMVLRVLWNCCMKAHPLWIIVTFAGAPVL